MKLPFNTVWQSPWFSVEQITAQPKLGFGEEPYFRIRHPDSVIIVPITREGQFVFVRQYRPTVERLTLELPAGGVDKDEQPKKAAIRELSEEAGMIADEIILLGQGGMLASRFFNTNSWFVAFDVDFDPNAVTEPELETVLLTPTDVRDLQKESNTDHLMAMGMISLARALFGSRVPLVW